MINAIDVGYGAVKGLKDGKEITFTSAVGNFRPVRFTSGLEKQDLIDRLCVRYNGKDFFVGSIAYQQSAPRVTMKSSRFTGDEGMVLLTSALMLLSVSQTSEIKLITGLPVNDFGGFKDKYKEALLGDKYIQLLMPDGTEKEFYRFNISDVKILPQPIGTIFDRVLNHNGELVDKKMASGRIAVLDIGKYTVDLALTDALSFVDRSSTSFMDIGIFDAFKDLSIELKALGFDIPPDGLEPYLTSDKIPNIKGLKDKVFTAQAEKILSRVVNTWTDFWNLDHVFVTGGGALLMGEYLKIAFESPIVTVCENPTFTNCYGYYKFGKRAWGEI